MSFLQPLLLATLPFIALPIVIHLINQRRYQTTRWGAMRFLLAANRMARGYARLRQLLILLFRMLALAGLIFAVSRPLASGWVGVAAGGRADTTIILLDRSPSMQQRRQGAQASKLETGREQLVRTLSKLQSARWVLIDSTTNRPLELESPDDLLRLAACEPTSTSADLPTMLQAAQDYIQSNRAGRSEIWLCSDMRENDWNVDDGRWQALRAAFVDASQGIRFHLLAYPDSSHDNLSVRVTEVRRRVTPESSELLLSLRLERELEGKSPLAGNTAVGDSAGARGAKLTVPVQFEIEGARSEISIEMSGAHHELKDHRILLDKNHLRGWGKVSIPADANPADNEYFFVFDQPVSRQTTVVADDPAASKALMLAATISPDPSVQCAAEALAVDQLATLAWEEKALLLWQAPLPRGKLAQQVKSFADRGGSIIFFPPQDPTVDELAGLQWQAWVDAAEGAVVATWRGDQDLLANTQSGAALPVGQLQLRKYCSLAGEHTALAALKNGAPLIGRMATQRGAIYFCATTPAPEHSSLAANGIVLYVMVQRALAAGAQTLGSTLQLVAGSSSSGVAEPTAGWRQLVGPAAAISTDFAHHAGVYQAEDRLFAVNAAAEENQAAVVSEQRAGSLFQGLDFARVNDQAGSFAALIDEIWRPFLVAMILALIAEAALCLPRLTPRAGAPVVTAT